MLRAFSRPSSSCGFSLTRPDMPARRECRCCAHLMFCRHLNRAPYQLRNVGTEPGRSGSFAAYAARRCVHCGDDRRIVGSDVPRSSALAETNTNTGSEALKPPHGQVSACRNRRGPIKSRLSRGQREESSSMNSRVTELQSQMLKLCNQTNHWCPGTKVR